MYIYKKNKNSSIKSRVARKNKQLRENNHISLEEYVREIANLLTV